MEESERVSEELKYAQVIAGAGHSQGRGDGLIGRTVSPVTAALYI